MLLLAMLVPVLASATPPEEIVLKPAAEPVVGDGERVATLRLEIKGAKAAPKRLQVKASRGKILSVGQLADGVAEVQYRPPRVLKPQKVVFTVSVDVGSQQLRRKVQIEVAPAATSPATDQATTPAPGPVADVSQAKPGDDARPTETAVTAPPLSSSVASVVSEPARASGREVFVLWEISGLGTAPELPRLLSDMVQGEMERLFNGRVSPRPSDEVKQRVADCTEELQVCLSEAAGATGADRLIYGTVATLGDAYSVNLRLVDAQTQQVLSRASANLSGERDQLLKQIEILLLKLVAPERLKGTLVLELNLSGAQVYLDGQHIGTAPLPGPIEGLPQGEHSLKVSSPEIQDYFTFFTVDYGKTSKVVVDATKIIETRTELQGAAHKWGPLAVGAKVGYTTNFRAISTPLVLSELALGLPILTDGLEAGIEGGYCWQDKHPTEPTRSEKTTVAIHLIPVRGKFSYSIPFGDWFAVRVGGTIGALLVYATVSSPSTGNVKDVTARLSAGGNLGLEIIAGPGRAGLEAAYVYVVPQSGLISGNLGGLAATLGYRFLF